MYEWIVFLALLLLSAFFSGYESAILSLRMTRIKELVKKHAPNAKLVERIKENQHRALITLLVGNNIANISISVLATAITFDIASGYGLEEAQLIAITTGIMTFILLIFAEITPKTLGVRAGDKFALRGARLFYLFYILFRPLVYIFEHLAGGILKLFGIKRQDNIYSSGELREFIEMSHQKGSIKQSQKEMITNVLEFNDTIVREIMKPLSKVVMVNADMTIAGFAEFIGKDNFSRIPVYEKHIEDIIGVIYIKDILPYLKDAKTGIKLRSIMRKIKHVPATKKISSLLHYFKARKEHIAVVVNEFGNTLGIVTMEDVLEELVGDIKDEYDEENESEVKVIDDSTIIAPGSINIEDVNELLGVKIEDSKGSYQTITGYIFFEIGKIPKTGAVINLGQITITVIDATHKKINLVKIESHSAKKR